jgi:quercetin dioxygenase-like cupin family protein
MISRRDVFVAAVGMGLALAARAGVDQARKLIGASVYDWNSIAPRKTDVGEVRGFFRGPTATLEELEVHVTTLNPGKESHPPHRHPNEEMVIVREGTVECLVAGEWKRVGPGSVIFNASNVLHGIRNVGAGPATYHVINFRTEKTPKE